VANLSEEEKDYLDDKFEQFKLDFWKRFKIPAIGLAVVFAGLVSIFSTYLYMQARVNVMESHADLAKAKATFYSGMQQANEEIEKMVENYNDMVEQAGVSVEMMKVYEKELAKRVSKHKDVVVAIPEETKKMPPEATTLMPSMEAPKQLAPMVKQRDVKIPEQYKKK